MSKVIIIGGGIAGLSAGIFAQGAGFEAEIYEKNPLPGGECMGWNRKGYHIDNCIHWLTGTRKGTDLYEIWKTVGALSDDTEYATVNSFYSTEYNGQRATLWTDLDRTRKELLDLSPEDTAEIEKMLKYVEYSRQCQFPVKKPMEMYNLKDYFEIGRKMADFPKVLKEFGKISLNDYSMKFKHPLLRKMLTDYLPGRYCAHSFFVSYATIVDGNGNIPMGASLQMSLRMEKRFKELGGIIHYGKAVDRIFLEKKKATGIVLDDGSFIEGDYIIPAVDTYILFNKMLPREYMPKILKTAYSDEDNYPVYSCFQAAFSVPVSFNIGETVFIGTEPLEFGQNTYDRMYIKGYNYDPVYISNDRYVIQTNISQTDKDFAYWKSLSKEEYQKKKIDLTEQIIKQIITAYPELEGNIEHLDTWTPLTYERYCNAYHGSYMSFTTTPGGKQVILNGKIKKISNVFPAGQWTYSPGGLPVAVASGKFAVQRICKKMKKDIFIKG